MEITHRLPFSVGSSFFIFPVFGNNFNQRSSFTGLTMYVLSLALREIDICRLGT